jgi:hypothetical protein
MTGSKKSPSQQEYTVIGDAAIYSGTFKDSTVTSNFGAQGADPWEQLQGELTKIRQRLERDSDPTVAPDDHDDALEAVTALKDDLPGLRKNDPDTRRRLKQRVKALIGMLAPVAEIVGGVAALQAICQHL